MMASGKKITVILSPQIAEMLDSICANKGIKRPAAISIAIEKIWKEEYGK